MSPPSHKEVLKALQPLNGFKLSAARNAAASKLFHFDEVTPSGKGAASEPSLLVQCAWRIAGPDGIVTGTDDRYRDPDALTGLYDVDKYDRGGDLQQRILDDILHTQNLVVTAVDVDAWGGITLQMSGGIVCKCCRRVPQVKPGRSLIGLRSAILSSLKTHDLS